MSDPTSIYLAAAACGWLFCGWLAVGACNADFYGDLGPHDRPPLTLLVAVFLLGIVGLGVAAWATANRRGSRRRPFYHGFRWGR